MIDSMARHPDQPKRDRELAARIRHGPRRAAGAAEVAANWIRRSGITRAHRGRDPIRQTLAEVLGPLAGRVRPVARRGATLIVEASDGTAASEIRQFHLQALVEALVAAGTGVSRLQVRLASSSRQSS